jgi:hypothetical protein
MKREHIVAIVMIAVPLIAALMLSACGDQRLGNGSGAGHAPNGSDANAMLLWLSVVAIAGFGACVAAAVFLPVKRLAVAVAVGCVAMLALALTTKAALPYLPWVSLALGVIGLAAGIWYFRAYVLSMQAAVAFGCAMEKAETDQDVAALKLVHAAQQTKNGTKRFIESALASIPR